MNQSPSSTLPERGGATTRMRMRGIGARRDVDCADVKPLSALDRRSESAQFRKQPIVGEADAHRVNLHRHLIQRFRQPIEELFDVME